MGLDVKTLAVATAAIAAAGLALFVTAPLVGAAPIVRESKTAGLRLTVTIPKETYIVGEPIIVSASLTNTSDAAARLADVAENCTVGIRVEKVSGNCDMPAQDSASVVCEDELACTFAAGEKRSISVNVQERYVGHVLPENTYSVFVTYSGLDSIRDIWHGQLAVPAMTFSVAPPAGDAAKACFQFIKSVQNLGKSESATVLKGLKNPEVGGVFARYAGYYEALSYCAARNEAKAIPALEEYLKQSPEVPYYSLKAREGLGCIYLRRRDYQRARSEFLKLPDCCDRRLWLSSVDSLERQAGKTPKK